MATFNSKKIILSVTVATIAALILGVLYHQSKQTLASSNVEKVSDKANVVSVERQYGGKLREEAAILPSLEDIYNRHKDDLVTTGGLIVDVLDRPGVPYIITIADNTGTADVVYFAPPADIKVKIAISKWMDLTARIDTYKGEVQLKPAAPELMEVFDVDSSGPLAERIPLLLERRDQMQFGDTVYFEGVLSRVKHTRSGKSVYGAIRIANLQEIAFYWNPPPDKIGEGLEVSGYALVGEYRDALQLQPYLSVLNSPR